MRQILFLCSGNYYRSRFAEIFFNHHARQSNLPWIADSRGLAIDSWNEGCMSTHTMRWLEQQGISFENYLREPRDLAAQDLAASHHVVAVKRTEHYPLMETRFPDWRDRVEYWEVHDLDMAQARDTLLHLEREVRALLHRLADHARANNA